ncbi:MAG: hypothetical protein AAF658_22050, partial [Myxococcota bacterium]
MKDETPPQLIVERVATGELPASELGPDREPALRALAESDAEILARYRPEEMAPAIQRRLARLREHGSEESTSISWWKRLALGAPLAAAAMLLMSVVPMGPHPHSDERVKGDAQLVLQRPTQGGGRELLNGESIVHPGERIQVGYRFSMTTNERRYGVIVSLDGGGATTFHLPEKGQAVELGANTLVALPHSFTLDAAPQFERFFFVTGPAPFALDTVVGAARAL